MSKRFIVLATLSLLAAGPAFADPASCPNGHTGNGNGNGNCGIGNTTTTTPTTTTPGNGSATANASPRSEASALAIGAGGAGGAGGSARQGQGQQQAQRASSDAQSNATGAGAGSGIVTIQGDQAGSGDTYKALALPSVVPFTPPTSIAGATVVVSREACGPLQRVVRTPVTGQFMGFWSTSEVPQGFTDALADFLDADGNLQAYAEHKGRLFGHQVTQYAAVVGTGGARNVAIGGGGSAGSWGQGGGGASGAAQQMVISIQLRLCQLGG